MDQEQIKIIIRQADPYAKTADATRGVGVAKLDFTKTFRNQLFSLVRVLLYHQNSITNYSESILKYKTTSILMIIFVVVFSI